MPRIKFYGEGPDDMGREVNQENLAALQIFVRKIIGEGLKRDIDFDYGINPIKDVKLHPKKYKGKGAGGFARKVSTAMQIATENNYDAVVFVVDYDEHEDRFEKMDEGRKIGREKDYTIPVVLGVAKKEIEAWLLADHEARRKVFGKEGGDDIGDIESRDDLKKLFGDLYTGIIRKNGFLYNKGREKSDLAQISNIETIAKKCKKGFKPFMEEVKEHLLPLFEGNQ